MPTVRYQIRNEYGLADPELYQTADKDDPEAILEGAAMAGLVGVLRQLGDLAEFAAEIFRDLHGQVVGTAARGHGLMLRVQQLEAEFPSTEKSLFSQSSHSNFIYNDGIDWHSNIQMDQNLITQGDMPRFILDSYEECCGPPRLFILDKFDTAGAGTCLKRYSDPSFFKMELVSSGLMQPYVSREKKSRKTRKKGSRWKNGQTLESLLLNHANSNLQPTTSDQVLDKSAPRFVRLKSRNLNGSNESEVVNLRKCLFELHSDGQEVLFDNSRIHSTINVISDDPSELASETHESFVGISANHLLARDGSSTTPAKAVKMLTTFEVNHWKKEDEALSKAAHQPFCEAENLQISFMEKEKFADSENKSEASVHDYNLSDPEKTTSLQVVDHTLVRAEHKVDGSSDGYRTEDVGSELENFVDALNSMESEVETDSEIKGGLELGIPTKEAHEMEFDSTWTLQHLETETSELNTEFSSDAVGILSVPYSDAMNISAEMTGTQEKVVTSDSSANVESFHGTAYNESCEELLPHDKVANSAYLNSDEASNKKTFDNLRSDIPDESCCLHVIDSTSSLNHLDLQGSHDAVKLLSADHHESAAHKVQPVPDEIAEFYKGLTHSGSTSPPESHHAENVDELILEDMMEALEMPNGLSCSPTRNAYVENPDRKHSLILTLPTMKEMQYSGNEDANAFTLEDDMEASTGQGSILTSAVASVPSTSTSIVKPDELAADLDNGHEESTLETSFDSVKGTGDISLSTKGSSLESKDDKISENHDLLCNPVKLIPEEKSLRTDMTDYVSDTERESSIINDLVWYTEIPEYHLNITGGKSLQLMNQDTVVNSTKTISPPVPVVATVSNEDSMMDMENVADVENIAYLRLEGCCENSHMAKDNHAMSEVTKSQLECFSGTVESQESSSANSAEESQESDKVNNVEEYKKSHKLHSAEESEESSRLNRAKEFQESPKVKAAEKGTLPDSGTDSHRVLHSCLHVLNNLKLPYDINQDSPQKDMQEAEQIIHARNLPAEDFASGEGTYNHDPSMLGTFDLLSRLPEDNTLDASVACEHPLMIHEIYSPRWEGIESHSNLNKSFSSGVENSALDPVALCSALPTKESSSANDVLPVEHFQAYLQTRVDENYMDYPVEVEDLCSKSSAQGHHQSAKQDLYPSTNFFSDPAHLPEGTSISQASDEVDLKPEFPQYKGEYLKLDVQSNSMDVGNDKQSDESETYNHDFVSNIDYNDMEVLSKNTDMTGVLFPKALVLSECSSEASAHHLALNVPDKTFSLLSSCDMRECSSEVSADHSVLDVPDKTLPLLSSSDMGFTDSISRLSYEHQLAEATFYSPSQNLEEPPPPPPLPPLEWRSQKLQLSSLLPSDNSYEPWFGTNLFTGPPNNQTAKSILPPALTLSKLPPIVVDQRYQHDALSLEKNSVHSANASSLSSLEFEKSLCVPGTEGASKLPVVESQISQYSTPLEERVHPTPDERSRLDQPCLDGELMKSHHSELSHPSLEKVPQPQNPFLDKSSSEDLSHQFTCGDLRGENLHLLESSAFSLSSGLGMPRCGYVYPMAGNQTTIFGVLPTTGDEWFGIKPCSIRNRPRTPLIEAVAAHDRSTLRKVSELTRPSNESKEDKKELLLESNILQLRKVSEVVKPDNKPYSEERDALLEQIRNKSFTLKPIVLPKPSNKSYCTDIKVAAILEKANALRQAVAGSDEEDAGDYWSDCEVSNTPKKW